MHPCRIPRGDIRREIVLGNSMHANNWAANCSHNYEYLILILFKNWSYILFSKYGRSSLNKLYDTKVLVVVWSGLKYIINENQFYGVFTFESNSHIKNLQSFMISALCKPTSISTTSYFLLCVLIRQLEKDEIDTSKSSNRKKELVSGHRIFIINYKGIDFVKKIAISHWIVTRVVMPNWNQYLHKNSILTKYLVVAGFLVLVGILLSMEMRITTLIYKNNLLLLLPIESICTFFGMEEKRFV